MKSHADKLLDYDVTKSDSDDGNYDDRAPRASPSKRVKRKAGKQPNGAARKAKRQRYRRDSEDSLDDDDDDEVESELDTSQGEEEFHEDVEINEKTNKPLRAITRRARNYHEPSDSEEELEEQESDGAAADSVAQSDQDLDEDEADELRPSADRRGNSKSQHIVKLKLDTRTLRSLERHTQTDSDTLVLDTSRRSSRIKRNSDGDRASVAGKRPPSRDSDLAPATAMSPRTTRGSKSVRKSIGFDARKHDDIEDDAITAVEPAIDANDADDAFKAPDVVVNGDDSNDDEDEAPIRGRSRKTLKRGSHVAVDLSPPASKKPRSANKGKKEDESDFDPDDVEAADEEMSGDERNTSPEKSSNAKMDGTGRGRRSNRGITQHDSDSSAHEDELLDQDEMAEEAQDLVQDQKRNRRSRRQIPREEEDVPYERPRRMRSKQPNYAVPALKDYMATEEVDLVADSQPNRSKRTQPYRSLFSIAGPFGGAGGPTPLLGGPTAPGAAAGGADSDSDDDDDMLNPTRGMGSTVGLTPGALLGAAAQTHNTDPAQATSGAPADLGKVKNRKALADADPLGVDPTVNFEGVGGLDDHIDRLKEMVALPLLYPEIFLRMHVTPPRGVLFHGPPGTGKTLLARALASSVSSNGQKVTFYMRKGADALSKWVGEAERQLRLLFEEARKNQPSIIFFDEIDGLAPVRSSKQEQIHASIVATLLALMDGMDGRGQVIVIGATNRPDSVDPALRRPGRFDREFYFPLPTEKARRSIIDIHTKGWEPPLSHAFKDQLSEITKGYGGADLRALCTEAALNAVQGTYPQIYSSSKKLLIDPAKIKVLAKDFMLSVNKIVPSSERSASSGAAPLAKSIEPLLRDPLAEISERINRVLPPKRRTNALEEAMYDDRDDEYGFEKETLRRDFESARIFRPRLLIRGQQGMGQQYLAAALLNKFEGVHVSNFDLPTLLKDSTRSPEAAVIQLFEEVKRHKPSVIFIPNVDIWYQTLQESVIRTFVGLLRSLPPSEPVLVMGMVEEEVAGDPLDPKMMRELFGSSSKNTFCLGHPHESALREFFAGIITNISRSPLEFPDPSNRKKRVFEELPDAPILPAVSKAPSKEEVKAQKVKDRHTLNLLKQFIQTIMDQIKLKYRKFRTPPIDESKLACLFAAPDEMVSDLPEVREQQLAAQAYKIVEDEKGVPGLIEAETGKFYYNLEITTIEMRLSNGYYMRPKDFTADIRRLAKDAKTMDDPDRILKANEMLANVEVDMTGLEIRDPVFAAECEAVYQREEERQRQRSKQQVPQAATTTNIMNGPLDSRSNVGAVAVPAFSDPFSQPRAGVAVPDTARVADVAAIGDIEMHDLPGNPAAGMTKASGVESQDLVIPESSQPYGSGHIVSSSTRPSDPTSDRSTGFNGEIPDFANMGPHGGSQLPDTQPPPPEMSSPNFATNGLPPITAPPRKAPDLDLILNSEPRPPASPPHSPLRLPSRYELSSFHDELVSSCSIHGLSIEECEQLLASLMDAVWQSRGEWDRYAALQRVREAMSDVMGDLRPVEQVGTELRR